MSQAIPIPATSRERAAQRIYEFVLAAHPGEELEAVIRKRKKERTDPQNRYLFGVAYPLLAAAKGYDVDEVHEWMCGRFFGWVDKRCPKTPRNPEGIESAPFRTTTRDENGKRDVLPKQRFSDFIEMVKRVGAQAGVFIPDPDQSPQPSAAA